VVNGQNVSSETDPAIYEPVNPTDLPRIEAAEVLSGNRDGIHVEPPGTDRKFNRYGASFVDDPDEVGLFPGGLGPAPYVYPPNYAAVIHEATLVGYRTILTGGHQFFTDQAYVLPEEIQHQLDRISSSDSFSNEETGLRPTNRERCFRFDPGGRTSRYLEGNVVVLCSDEPFSYGSFLFRVLPKVMEMRRSGLSGTPCIAFVQPKPFKDLLNLCGVSSESILPHDVRAVTRIERAIVPSMRNPHAYLDPASLELFAELRTLYGTQPKRRRIYVSRVGLNNSGRGASRIMTNETDLIARLRVMHFEIVEPETLSVRDQIMTFSAASIVVGPSGSGLFNTMFCHPGTKVIDIQSEPQWIYSYTGMYSSLSLDYGIFIGKPDPADTKPVHREFAVNIEALTNRIRSFMAEGIF
jgi:capsular polysaccharide biosynthesis protein